MTVQKRSAMGENQKVQILSNEVRRRLLNTREGLEGDERIRVLDTYAVKLKWIQA